MTTVRPACRRRPARWGSIAVRAVYLTQVLPADEARNLADGSLAREPGRLLVSPAAALASDLGDVDAFGRRPQADAARRAVLRRRLTDQGRELGAFDGAQVVDDPLGVRLLCAGPVEVGALEVRDDHAAAVEDLGVLECARDELQLRERDVLVDALEHAVHVCAGLDELG